MITPPITLAQLALATLDRQMLLRRHDLSPKEAVARLFGLQAQLPRPTFLGLHSRLADFDGQSLKDAIHGKEILRVTGIRATLHLMTREDYITLRPCIQPCLEAAALAIIKQRKASLDIPPWVAFGAEHFRNSPQTMTSLRDAGLAVAPDLDERALGYLVRTHVPLVQLPNQSQWAYPSVPSFLHADTYLGAHISTEPQGPGPLICRYLKAFGPSSLADIQSFTGLKGLAADVKALGERLRVYALEGGGEVYDLGDETLPALGTPAPPRFLPDFDNVLIARSDERFLDRAHRKAVFKPGLRVLPTLMVDGRVVGTWKADYKAKVASLKVSLFAPLPSHAAPEVEAEGALLLKLLYAKAKDHQIHLNVP